MRMIICKKTLLDDCGIDRDKFTLDYQNGLIK